MSLYVSQQINIEITCLVDGSPIGDALAATIQYRKPTFVTGTWDATISGSIVRYTASPTDIDVEGTWKLQPIVTTASGVVLPGTTVNMRILPRYA